MPHWYGRYLMGKLIFDLTLLESAIVSGNQLDIIKYRQETLKGGKKTVSHTGKKVALERTEAYKLMGRYYWLIGKQKKALKWWDRSIKEGERLGARVELSRAYFEVGKRLLESQSKYRQLNGIDAQGYLEKAKTLFEEMDLQWDLDDLDKIVSD